MAFCTMRCVERVSGNLRNGCTRRSEADGFGRSYAGLFRRSAAVFTISCESTSSDTARAIDIAPTSPLKGGIALDLAARLSVPGSQPGNQLKVYPDLSRAKRTGPFVTARDLRRQGAERPTRTRILGWASLQ